MTYETRLGWWCVDTGHSVGRSSSLHRRGDGDVAGVGKGDPSERAEGPDLIRSTNTLHLVDVSSAWHEWQSVGSYGLPGIEAEKLPGEVHYLHLATRKARNSNGTTV